MASCSGEHSGPTSGTDLGTGNATGPLGVLPTGSAAYRPLDGFQGLNEDEEFNCTNIGEVRVRFSHPGWVQDNAVGLFVEFRGVPDQPRALQVWWDYDGDPGHFENVVLQDGDVYRDRNADGLIVIDKVIEHTYDVSSPERKTVRVELIMKDLTGNCARVREASRAAGLRAVAAGGRTTEPAGIPLPRWA
jgi:hypothetical protein